MSASDELARAEAYLAQADRRRSWLRRQRAAMAGSRSARLALELRMRARIGRREDGPR